jgi:hypothetical protein
MALRVFGQFSLYNTNSFVLRRKFIKNPAKTSAFPESGNKCFLGTKLTFP